MDVAPHLLLLAGAGEAREIAARLAGKSDLRVTASLHYPERAFGPLAVPTRIGGFGGESGFEAYLKAQSITAVLDATHPFAVNVSTRSCRVCARTGLAYAQVLRPEWDRQSGDHWVDIADESAAAGVIPPGKRVFVTTGRATLAQFQGLHSARLFVRQLTDSPHRIEMKNTTYVRGTAPFSVDQEISLFRELEIVWLVTRNSGGHENRTKIDAARALGIPVAMIRRPMQPESTKLTSVQAALDWVAALCR